MTGHPMMGWITRGAVVGAVAALVLVFPLSRSGIEVNIFTEAVIYAIVGLSLNVLLGYAGQISLGHQAFVGIGAFTSAYMTSVHEQNFVAALGVTMVVGAVQALLLGVVSLRITGLYFALVTLAYGRMAENSLFNITSLTGGSTGQAAPKPAAFASDFRYYYLCLAVLAVVLYVDWRLTSTKTGRALLAIRRDPRVAASFGASLKRYTLIAFVVSGVFASVAGALLAHNATSVVSSQFEFRLALVFVIMTVVGGLRSRAGVVVGSAFFSLTDYLFDKLRLADAINAVPFLPDLSADLAPLVLGPLLLLFTLTRHPGGFGDLLRPIGRWLRDVPPPASPTTPTSPQSPAGVEAHA
ncbi:MAG TPA: branched-chain amino acid ABC transporter permease [Acidimicrobiia bacterium]|nr:branched-chain amino acid ABC transporter permease [Acidimicrobiia bacterium]